MTDITRSAQQTQVTEELDLSLQGRPPAKG